MDMFLYICGIVISILLLIGALIATIMCYLVYCSKYPMRKLAAEIFIVLFVSLISLAVRMAIMFTSLPHDSFSSGSQSAIYGILSTVAELIFNFTFDLSGYNITSGILVSLYYGTTAYASFVFLSVITVGVSYDVYSRIQTMLMRFKKRCTYYIFTSITKDSLVLAEDIKRHESAKKGKSYVIIFFENGEGSFSRKNPLHRKIVENGFYYFSDPRCTDKGETICFLKKFRFTQKNCLKDDVGENRSKLFYIFALDDSGDYERVNADVIYDDMQAAVKAYVTAKNGLTYNKIPTALNYYILTSGEVNYESYERRTKEIIEKQLSGLPSEFYWDGGQEKPESLGKYVSSKIQVNVVSEATLSSHTLISARKENLKDLGSEAFSLDVAPSEAGAYRVAVIGFGKTGQYAMEELFTHTAALIEKDGQYVPTKFVADVFDTDIEQKSGMFAYSHPLFRCIDDKGADVSDINSVFERAKGVSGEAMEVLYSEYKELMKKRGKDISYDEAKDFIDCKMAFPIAVMHKGNCFSYPFLADEGTETAIAAVCENGVRDFVVALGNDEKNIEMANMLIDSFRRLLLRASLSHNELKLPHIKIYVNLIEKRNKSFLSWRRDEDKKLFARPYAYNEKTKQWESPKLSVIPFGYREEMYSYDALIEDYKERIYNYGYNFKSNYIGKTEPDEKARAKALCDEFLDSLAKDYNAYRSSEKAIDDWMRLSQFLRLSNRSALDFAVNYYRYNETHGKPFTPEDWEYMQRLEHERWNRFYMSHGWVYATYYKDIDASKSEDEQKAERTAEKRMRRDLRQHNCLCPFDEMLDESTKNYDRGNVELGLVKGIVFDE